MGKKYVSLHNHSTRSLLDGMINVNDLVDRTLALDQPASVITDHGNMYTIVDHFKQAKSKGQKAIAGFEAYVAKDHFIKAKTEGESENTSKREHLILLAENEDGYKKLCRICSLGFTEGFYYRPRIDDKILNDIGTKGIIATSACLAGRIDQCLLRDDIESAEKWAVYYYKLFNEKFWLEIQPTELQEQIKVNLGLIEIHKKTGIPITATTDSHYLYKEEKESHDVLLALQSNSLMSNPNRWKFTGNTYYVMSREEILNSFKINGHEVLDQKIVEEAVDSTTGIAEMCNVEFGFDKHYLPKIDIPKDNEGFNKWLNVKKHKGKENEDYLKYLCIKGLKEKNLTSQIYRERLEYELQVINEMEFPDYFLIYEDIANFCKENNVAIGPARGCATLNNEVNIENGTKFIQDVKIGEKVWCHDEKLHEVEDTLVYDIDEDVIELKADKECMQMTQDHKVYAIKKYDFDNGIRTPNWYKICDLDIGDYVCGSEIKLNRVEDIV